MNKKKQNEQEDSPDGNKSANALQLLYQESLVAAFAENHMSVDSENIATSVMTIGMIREYFSAWAIDRIGDPINLYLDGLASYGFCLRASFSGEPALFVRFHSRDSDNSKFKALASGSELDDEDE